MGAWWKWHILSGNCHDSVEGKKENYNKPGNCHRNKIIVTGAPVFNKKGEIEIVIFNSRDVTSLEDIEKSYQDMKKSPKEGKCQKWICKSR
jgi:transcriptional regulator with PAS, ATPase and Fis domain